MRRVAFAFLTLLIVSVAANARVDGAADKPDLLVTTAWLAAHLHDENLVVLHAHWTNGSYKKGHIPGARFLWLNSLAKDTPERSTELPSIQEAGAVLTNLGISERSRIVVYFEGQNMTMATRMIFTLSYFGLGDRSSLLDGGFEAWKSEGRPVSKEIPKISPGTFTPRLQPEAVSDVEWVRQHLSDPNVAVIDARAKRFYDGAAGNPPGHLPHAISVPFSSVADSTNRMLSPDSLRAIFGRAGVKPGNHLHVLPRWPTSDACLFCCAMRRI